MSDKKNIASNEPRLKMAKFSDPNAGAAGAAKNPRLFEDSQQDWPNLGLDQSQLSQPDSTPGLDSLDTRNDDSEFDSIQNEDDRDALRALDNAQAAAKLGHGHGQEPPLLTDQIDDPLPFYNASGRRSSSLGKFLVVLLVLGLLGVASWHFMGPSSHSKKLKPLIAMGLDSSVIPPVTAGGQGADASPSDNGKGSFSPGAAPSRGADALSATTDSPPSAKPSTSLATLPSLQSATAMSTVAQVNAGAPASPSAAAPTHGAHPKGKKDAHEPNSGQSGNAASNASNVSSSASTRTAENASTPAPTTPATASTTNSATGSAAAPADIAQANATIRADEAVIADQKAQIANMHKQVQSLQGDLRSMQTKVEHLTRVVEANRASAALLPRTASRSTRHRHYVQGEPVDGPLPQLGPGASPPSTDAALTSDHGPGQGAPAPAPTPAGPSDHPMGPPRADNSSSKDAAAQADHANAAPATSTGPQLLAVDMWNGSPSVLVTSGIAGDSRTRTMRPGDTLNGVVLRTADPANGTATFESGGKTFTLSLSDGG